jgi:hypothetical protein
VIPDNEKPSIPMHENCDPNWLFSSSSNKCYILEYDEKSWGAASSDCQGRVGQLAAIDSPDLQKDILTLSQLDGTAFGEFLYHTHKYLTDIYIYQKKIYNISYYQAIKLLSMKIVQNLLFLPTKVQMA